MVCPTAERIRLNGVGWRTAPCAPRRLHDSGAKCRQYECHARTRALLDAAHQRAGRRGLTDSREGQAHAEIEWDLRVLRARSSWRQQPKAREDARAPRRFAPARRATRSDGFSRVSGPRGDRMGSSRLASTIVVASAAEGARGRARSSTRRPMSRPRRSHLRTHPSAKVPGHAAPRYA
jgi:hypothetical protein